MAREKLSIPQLKIKANDVRRDVVHMLELAKSGHPGGALGLADIVTALYFNIMNIDPQNPEWPERDINNTSNTIISAAIKKEPTNPKIPKLIKSSAGTCTQ